MTAICLSLTTWAGSAWQPGDVCHEGDGECLPSESSWAVVDPPGKLRLEWRVARGDRTICTYRLEGSRRFFRLDVGPDDVHVELREIAPENVRPPHGVGMEKFTSSAAYGFIRWAPGGATPEAAPKVEADILHRTSDSDLLHRGTR